MQKSSVIVGLVLSVVITSGCAPYVGSYRGRYPHPRYPMMPPAPMATVDPEAMARGRWDQVMRLAAGSTIEVLTWNGALAGKFSGADGYTVRVLVGGIEEQIARADVMRVDLVDLPGSEAAAVAKRAARGALIGLGGAALLVGVIGEEAWPPPGILVRGAAAMGGVAGGQAALVERGRRVIYLAEDLRPPQRQPVQGSDANAKESAARLENFARETAMNAARTTVLAALMKAFVGPSAAFLPLGAPAHLTGGGRSAILSRQPWVAIPAPFGGAPIVPQRMPSTGMGRGGAAICQSEPARLQHNEARASKPIVRRLRR